MTEAIHLPRSIVKRLSLEAQKRGLSLEEYVLELVLQPLDPSERAREYLEAAKTFLEEAQKELSRGNVRQAAEKLWGATALTVKAYAYWKEGRRLISHGELWVYKRELEKELGEWVSDAWAQATAMHICLYEGWCSKEDIEKAMKRISRLVEEVKKKAKSVE